MILYYQPHRSRRREKTFFDFLMERESGIEHRQEAFVLPEYLLRQTVSRDGLMTCLERDTHLPVNAKLRSLEALHQCPQEIYVSDRQQGVSVDLVLVRSGVPIFVEFHERQHRRLSDNRPKVIFDAQGQSYTVPRGIQRLIRDVWRCLYLRPFSVVWWDWFEMSGEAFELPGSECFVEFSLRGKFSFGEFLLSYSMA